MHERQLLNIRYIIFLFSFHFEPLKNTREELFTFNFMQFATPDSVARNSTLLVVLRSLLISVTITLARQNYILHITSVFVILFNCKLLKFFDFTYRMQCYLYVSFFVLAWITSPDNYITVVYIRKTGVNLVIIQ